MLRIVLLPAIKALFWHETMKNKGSEIIIYQTDDGLAKINVRMDRKNTLALSGVN